MQKQLITKVFSALLIVMLALGAMSLQTAQAKPQAAISVLQAWSTVHTGNASPGTNTYAVNAGSNRMLVVAVSSSTSAVAGTQTATATYGGQTLTEQVGDGATSTQQHTWLFYLQEAGLQAASSTDLVVNVTGTGGTIRYNYVYAAVYAGVDQSITPITDFKNYNGGATASTTVGPFAAGLTINSGDRAVEIVNLTRTGNQTAFTISTWAANWSSLIGPNTGAYNAPGGGTQPADLAFSAYVSTNTTAGSTTSQHTANGAVLRSMSAMSIKAAPDSTAAGTATASAANATSINVSMPYTDDANGNNTYTVEYKQSSAISWTNWVTNASHTASPYTTTITGLSSATSYDVRVTYNDANGVTGTNPQTISNITTPIDPFNTKLPITGNANPVTQSYTVGSGGDLLVLSIVTNGTIRAGGAPTFNSIAFTQADSTRVASETVTEMWYLVNPPTGAAYNISIPNTGGITLYATASSYFAQTGYSYTLDVANGNAVGGGGSANPAVSVTTTADGDVIVGAMGNGNNNPPTGRSGTVLYETDNGFFSDNSQYFYQATAGVYATNWTIGQDDWSFVVAAFKQVPGTTSVGSATATTSGSTSIDVSMPYTNDGNENNTYTVEYKLSSAGSWTNWVTNATHTASPYATTITGLSASTSYDMRVTYNDTDGVTGTNPQTISNITTSATPVSILNGWPANPQFTATTGSPSGTFTISAGSNRLLVVAVGVADGGATGHTFSATYGGKTLTQAATENSTRRATWIGYLKESDIASRTGDTLSVTVTGTHTGVVVYVASYSNVDQTAPITQGDTSYANNAGTVAIGPLSVTPGGYGVYTWAGTNGRTRTSDTESYTEYDDAGPTIGGDLSDYGIAAKLLASVNTTNPTITWTNNARMSVSFITFNPSTAPAMTDQTITFGALANKVFGDADFGVSAIGGASGNPVTFSSQTLGTCTVTGSTVSIVAAGTCTVRASQAGNATYNPAPDVDQSFTIAQASQTITFGVLANKTYGDADFAVSATGGASGNPVTFSSQTPLTCTLAGSTVTIVAAGTCTVRASQAGNANYTAAPDVDQSFTITQVSQNITFGALANKTYGDADFAVSATGGASGNPVTFSSQTPLTCTLAGSTVSIVGAGTCTVRASQAGNANYSVATDVDQSFTVSQASQTISFGALADKTYGDADFAVSATGGASGNPVTFSSQTPLTCTLAGSTVTIVAAGTCTVRASQAGNANYSAATDVDQSFTVNQASQTITFGALGNKTYGDADFAVSATGGASGNPVTFSSQTPLTCTLAGSTVSIVAAGTCTVRASQAGNANYSAAPDVDQSFTINQASQTITFGPLPSRIYGDPDFTVSATGGASGNPVTFSSTTLGTCTVTGNTVSILTAGTCKVLASQAGNANYSAALDVERPFTIELADQAITFGALADKTYGDADFAVSATGGASGNPVTFNSQTPVTCSVTGNIVSILQAGACTIRASQAGNANYNAAPDVDQSFTINQASQTITFGALADKTYGDADFNVSATGGASGNPVTFSSQTPVTCSVTGNTVSILQAGTCTVRASQAGNVNYSAAPDVDQSFTINQASQTITFGALADKTYGDADFNVSATGGASGNPVTFSSQTPATCSVTGNMVTILAGGACTVRASQAGNVNYSAAPDMDQSFTINQASQTITFGALTDKTYGDADFTVSATASSTLVVSFNSQTPGTCTVTGNNVSILAGGTCTIRALQSGDGNYSAAPDVDQSFTVNQASQNISITSTAPVGAVVGGPVYTPAATGGASGNPLVFTIDAAASSICLISGGDVSFLTIGTCIINANQAGNTNYSAATQVQQSFAVGLGSQTITFTSTAPANAIVGGATYTPTATGGGSGNPVVFTVDASASSVCSISGGDVSFLTSGVCIVNANQTGNTNYFAAPQVQQIFGVGKATPVVTWSNPADIVYGTALSGTQLNATASVAGAFTYTPVSGTTLNAGAGQILSVDFVPTDTLNYNNVNGTTVTINVLKATPTLSVTNSPVTYNGTPQVAIVVGSVPGTVSNILYDGSATAPTLEGTYAVIADFAPTNTTNYNSLTAASAGNFVIKSDDYPTFSDVPTDYWAWQYIEAIYAVGITGGCNTYPLNYCPTAPVTRAEMAIFLLRGTHGKYYNPPTATGVVFTDVPVDYWAASWIEQLAMEGITGGCGDGIYCPDAPITRAQMSIFLLRTKYGSDYIPPTATGTLFADVPVDYWAADWVEQLFYEDIARGCGDGNFCPDADVTRDQMAVFLQRLFGFPLP